MTSDQQNIVIFKDQAGGYYLLPQDTLEHGRVPETQKGEIERLRADAGDEVTGFFFHFVHPQFAEALAREAAVLRWLEQQLMSGGPA